MLTLLFEAVSVLAEAAVLFLAATVMFDLVHMGLHRCMKSRHPFLRRLAAIHLPHHRFFSCHLKIHKEHTKANLFSHVMFENGVQCVFILLGFFFFSPMAVLLAVIFQAILFVTVYRMRGVDPHHQSYDHLPAYHGGIFVSAAYHALHHHYSSNYYSSYIKIVDFIFGTGHHLAKKNIVMTGASGALGSQMKKLLEQEGAKVTSFKFREDYDYDHYEKLIPALSKADILFLCHGSKVKLAQAANCDSYVKLIELYKQVRPHGLLPLEVWATGSEIECHPCFGIPSIKVYAASKRNFAKYAHVYYADPNLQYRHLVHSAFMSKMGPGLMSAKFAAFMSLFLIKRGCRYVPVSYTGIAFVNYFRFLLKV